MGPILLLFIISAPLIVYGQSLCSSTNAPTICLAAPLHASTFNATRDCGLLSAVLGSGSGTGSFTWAATYCQAGKPPASITATITTPDAMFYSCFTATNYTISK